MMPWSLVTHEFFLWLFKAYAALCQLLVTGFGDRMWLVLCQLSAPIKTKGYENWGTKRHCFNHRQQKCHLSIFRTNSSTLRPRLFVFPSPTHEKMLQNLPLPPSPVSITVSSPFIIADLTTSCKYSLSQITPSDLDPALKHHNCSEATLKLSDHHHQMCFILKSKLWKYLKLMLTTDIKPFKLTLKWNAELFPALVSAVLFVLLNWV